MSGMKVVETDNFGGDYPYEVLVVAGVSRPAAQSIADIINSERCVGNHSRRFWKVEDEGYVLNTEGPNG
jgi:hypothetical protein